MQHLKGLQEVKAQAGDASQFWPSRLVRYEKTVMVWQKRQESCVAQLVTVHGPVQLGLTWTSSMLTGAVVEAAEHTVLNTQVSLPNFASAAAASYKACLGQQPLLSVIDTKTHTRFCKASAS